jgi:iron complex transport system ATP-binding protein
MENAYEICNLSFRYDEDIILDKIDFSVKNGSFTTIIGPNGSGKSTLIKLLAGNLSPNSGELRLWGKGLAGYISKELARIVAVVPQEINIQYDFTVHDIVLMGRHPHIKRFERESVKDYQVARNSMERTNTWHLRERSINELSGGERQRVIIAKALAQEPKIILLDEPTSSLDIHHQLEVLTLLKELNEETGVTIIMVLHDINLAARFSQVVALLHLGSVVKIGKTEEVLTVENLQKAYDMEMIIEKNIYTGCLNIIPLSVKRQKGKE